MLRRSIPAFVIGNQQFKVSVQDLGPSLPARIMERTTTRPSDESFTYEAVLDDALKEANLGRTDVEIPQEEWWKKLCNRCGEKGMSSYGAYLLRKRLVHGLSERLKVEEAYRMNGSEIEKCQVKMPFFVVGLPRCNGMMAAHVMARTGCVFSPTMKDTYSPSLHDEIARKRTFESAMRGVNYLFPALNSLRQMDADRPDDDTMLHLQVPNSLAWGLLHGLDRHLYETIQECDQTETFQYLKKVMLLYEWYRQCGSFSDAVDREYNQVNIPLEMVRWGSKPMLTDQPWVVRSPFAICHMSALHAAFPDMRVVWCHRALSACVPSMCSAMAIHDSMYTGRAPSETNLVSIGEKVCGLFGSGSENAVEYMANFPTDRLVNWSNRDSQRSCSRLMMKTLGFFGMEPDRHRRMQGINGEVEYNSGYRAMHDSRLQFFGLHHGTIGESFDSYIHQFEEYAFEPIFGVEMGQQKLMMNTGANRLHLDNDKSAHPMVGQQGVTSLERQDTHMDNVLPRSF